MKHIDTSLLRLPFDQDCQAIRQEVILNEMKDRKVIEFEMYSVIS